MRTPAHRDEQISAWRRRWESHPSWIDDVISCFMRKPQQDASSRILRLPWYSSQNGFKPLTISPDHSNTILDLRGVPLRNEDLPGISIPFSLLDGADFFKANLRNADLSFIRGYGLSFHQAQMEGVKLIAARLDWADLSMAYLQEADLSRARLNSADLGWANLGRAKFRSAHLYGAIMEKIEAVNCNFSNAEMNQANLSLANCAQSNFVKARLVGAKFVAANLTKTDFCESLLVNADLCLADLKGANLPRAQMRKADLTRAHLGGADLTEADLSESKLFAVKIEEARLCRANLNNAQLKEAILEGCDLSQCSLRGVDLTQASLLQSNLESTDLRESDLNHCRIRSAGASAIVNTRTLFGGHCHQSLRNTIAAIPSDWLTPPYSSLPKSEREKFDPSEACSLANQIRMLFRDNGLFRQAAKYFEEENYWLTRTLSKEKHWLRYIGRLLFLEAFMGYGEKPGRIVLTGTALIFLFSLLYLFGGITAGGSAIDYDLTVGIQSVSQFLADFWTCILFSIQCFTTLNLGTITPLSGITTTAATVEGVLGFFIIALGIVVFVRKAVRE